MTPVIHWFRRDLRIADNTALYHASLEDCPVIPVYILSNWKRSHRWTGAKKQQFLCGCLSSLAKNLETLSGKLIIREGDVIEQFQKLISETGAKAVYWNRDPDPFGKALEEKLEKVCAEMGVASHVYDDVALHTPLEVLTLSQQPYKVYTPYSKNWLKLQKGKPFPKPKQLDTPLDIFSLNVPTLTHWDLDLATAHLPEPGERAARERMDRAISSVISTYSQVRDVPGKLGTSRLSQDLRFGLISIRTLYQRIMEAREKANGTAVTSIDIYIKELAWREFYFAILHHFPHVLEQEFNQDWLGLAWEKAGENFEKWKQGMTGFPIVDAGIRELLATGFMHNRVRMITAMFLTKDLHIDWRLGESFFMQHLIDGEIASNNGGWQWSAGTGADAAPYFRVQNPWAQTERFDPDGAYIKQWIPELQHVNAKRFFAPPENHQPLVQDYPLPCVDHKTERDRTLELFKSHRALQKICS